MEPCTLAFELWKDKRVRFYISNRKGEMFYGIRYSQTMPREEGWFSFAEIELLNKYEGHHIKRQPNFRAMKLEHCL